MNVSDASRIARLALLLERRRASSRPFALSDLLGPRAQEARAVIIACEFGQRTACRLGGESGDFSGGRSTDRHIVRRPRICIFNHLRSPFCPTGSSLVAKLGHVAFPIPRRGDTVRVCQGTFWLTPFRVRGHPPIVSRRLVSGSSKGYRKRGQILEKVVRFRRGAPRITEDHIENVQFICVGNIYRSPRAASFLADNRCRSGRSWRAEAAVFIGLVAERVGARPEGFLSNRDLDLAAYSVQGDIDDCVRTVWRCR